MAERAVVRPGTPADGDRIAALLDEVLGGQPRAGRDAVWRWRAAAPGADPDFPGFLVVERGGRILGRRVRGPGRRLNCA